MYNKKDYNFHHYINDYNVTLNLFHRIILDVFPQQNPYPFLLSFHEFQYFH